MPTPNEEQGQQSSSSTSITEDFALSFFVVVGAASLLGTLFLVKPYMRARQLEAHQGAFPHAGEDHTQATESLPGRGEGSEGDDMDPANMEESDRWLQQVSHVLQLKKKVVNLVGVNLVRSLSPTALCV